MPRWERALVAASTLAGLFAIFHPVLQGKVLGGHTGMLPPFERPVDFERADMARDVELALLPFRAHTHREYARGRVPLWNPYGAGGAPFAGNQQSAVFHPFTLLGLLLPWRAALVLVSAGTFLLAFGGTWMLARDLGATPLGAALAAVSFAMGGFVVEPICYPFLGTLVHLPILVALARRHARGELGPAWLAAALASSILMGHFEYLPVIWLIAGLSWLGARGDRALARGVLTFALGAGLSALMLLPSIEYLVNSTQLAKRRGLGPRATMEGGSNSSPANAAKGLERGVAFGSGHPLRPLLPRLGAIPLLLAAAAATSRPRLLAATLFGAALVAQDPLATLFWKLPVFGWMVHHRMIVPVSLGIALLAGLGLDRLRRNERVAVSVAAGLVLVSALRLWDLGAKGSLGLDASIAGAVLCLAAISLRGRGPDRAAVAILALLVAERGVATSGVQRWDRASRIFQPHPLIARAMELAGHDRILDARGNTGLVYGYHSLRLYDAVGVAAFDLARTGDLSGREDFSMPYRRSVSVRVAILGKGGVPDVDAEALPRARLDHAPGVPVAFVRDDPSDVLVAFDAPAADRVVLADVAFPGWTADVDGRRVPIVPEKSLRAVDVAAGPHRVRFVYAPVSFRLGFFLTLIALLSVALAPFLRPRPARR